MLQTFDTIQTFYINPASVNNSTEVLLTSVELYFKTKPDATKNVSGTAQPGVILNICPVENDQPILLPIASVRVEYNKVYAMADASVSTVFSFTEQVSLQTDKFYAIVIQTEDLGYELWVNKQGDAVLGSNLPSSGSSNVRDGKYYRGIVGAIDSALKPVSDTDIKFKVNIAKYLANTMSIALVNRDYEFLTYTGHNGIFLGGEYIYQTVANSAGTLNVKAGNTTISGVGTAFAAFPLNSYIAAINGSNVSVFKISNIVNNTIIQVSTPPSFTNAAASFMQPPIAKQYYVDNIKNKIHLINSTANSTNKFSAAGVITGETSGANATIVSVDDLPVDHFTPKVLLTTPSHGQMNVVYGMAYSNGSAYLMPSSYDNMLFNQVNEITRYKGTIRSRSNEVSSPYLYSSALKSSVTTINMSVDLPSTALYTAPVINSNEIDFFIRNNLVSNVYTVSVGGVTYDTEVQPKNGTATAKHISRKVTFANNRYAEDLRIYLTGYRPLGTAINVYAKIHNSTDPDSFDDKPWTPLIIIENNGLYSSSSDDTNFIEYTYSLPFYSETANTISGNFTTQLSNAVMAASGVDPTTFVSTNSAVKIYNPVIPSNYAVAIVASANSSSITLTAPISNNNVVGNGYKVDVLKYPNIAFNNPINFGISAYYNTYFAEYDKFDSVQVKVVMLADNTNLIPKVDRLEVIGVSV